MFCIKKSLVKTIAYYFTDIPFSDSHSPNFLDSHSPKFSDSHSPNFFIKNDSKLLKENALEILRTYDRTKAQRWP